MSQQQQQTKRKYLNFAAGWFKNTAKGEQYISARAGNPKQKVDLFVSVNGGPQQKVEYFGVFFEKQDPNYTPRDPNKLPPDVRFTFSTEE